MKLSPRPILDLAIHYPLLQTTFHPGHGTHFDGVALGWSVISHQGVEGAILSLNDAGLNIATCYQRSARMRCTPQSSVMAMSEKEKPSE